MPLSSETMHFPVDKSNITWVKHDPSTRNLYVNFRGRVYLYVDVPGRIFTEIMLTPGREKPLGKEKPKSVGSYVNHFVKPFYACRELSAEEIKQL